MIKKDQTTKHTWESIKQIKSTVSISTHSLAIILIHHQNHKNHQDQTSSTRTASHLIHNTLIIPYQPPLQPTTLRIPSPLNLAPLPLIILPRHPPSSSNKNLLSSSLQLCQFQIPPSPTPNTPTPETPVAIPPTTHPRQSQELSVLFPNHLTRIHIFNCRKCYCRCERQGRVENDIRVWGCGCEGRERKSRARRSKYRCRGFGSP